MDGNGVGEKSSTAGDTEPSSSDGLESGEPASPSDPAESFDSFECCVCLDLIYKPVVIGENCL
ncbi:unnamed protein product [Spirodela intermedia]|uniref:Uncharacterized protein n=2 Tax=Spirodela intermedia TaxID=51605 RepID=A0A7I8KMA5_SPIIN|nr:unnamed protein product [Spirodela intermedia]CAA6662516.1 unnamed protein product [Spirodela intermedia]CAA7398917.1 unnamed protein product [Spirodela intermedia]